MQVASQIRKSVETLLSDQTFTSHILQYTRSALQTIYNLPQSQEIDTPPSYILLLSHLINTNQPLLPIISSLTTQTQGKVMKLVEEFREERGTRLDNSFFNNLSDVEWEMSIQSGREIYQLRLFTFQSSQPFTLRLNYEQLSILTFQVNQIVNQITQLQRK